MGIMPEICYKAQAAFLKYSLNSVNVDDALVYTKVWFNITLFGCGYVPELEQKCWDICPSILKDEYLGVFKIPYNL